LPKGIAIDRGVALPPLNLTLARMLMDGTRIGGVLAALGPGYAHTGAELALALVKVSQILTDLPEVVGLDIDPLLADAHGIVAEGCRVRIAPAGAHPHRRLAIRPYPRELEKLVTTRRGQTLLLRPMRPEDEPALRTFVRNLDPNDIRLRFFSPIKELDPRFAARLTQIDYDREMAFVAVDPEAPDGGLWGVMRVSADANAVSAEYAGAVRSDLKGHGLGRLMMEEIIAYARSRGIEEIWGSVLAENTPMLALNRKLGFQIKTDPDDRSVVHVSLSLAGQAGTPPPTPPVQGS
jgi:acetyltransferase